MTSDQYNGVPVITAEGDLAGAEAAAVLGAVERRPPVESGKCVIDLERCRFISGEGLGALVNALRCCESRGAALKLAGLDENCRIILQMTRLDHRFECCPDVAAAMKTLSQ